MIKAGIFGATGYAGQELTKLLTNHPDVAIHFLATHSNAGTPFSDVYPHFTGVIDQVCVSFTDAKELITDCDVIFFALPHGLSFEYANLALEAGVKVIDIGSDYRLKSLNAYQNWYGLKHEAEAVLEASVYALPEWNKEQIKTAQIIANPGCYPTASTLAILPLVEKGLIDLSSIIIDAKSGVTGAGRSAKTAMLFTEVNESIKAYGVASHRHTPEIEQTLSWVSGEEVVINFTPHLIPMNRGILSTVYANLKVDISEAELKNIYKEYYADAAFTNYVDFLPETRFVSNTNHCIVTVRKDERTNRVIAIGAIDNLLKGAAGQAVQNMNIAFGLEETSGIEALPKAP